MEAINKDAEYICLDYNNSRILVDMHDIDDILPVQQVQIAGDTKIKTIYSVMFTDHTFWQLIMDDKTLKRFQKFKEKHKLDKNK